MFLRRVVDTDENLIFVRDQDGRFLLCNTAMATLVNLQPSVRSMLQLQYPEFQVVVINDGSKDRTLEVLIDEFALVLHPEASRSMACCWKPCRSVDTAAGATCCSCFSWLFSRTSAIDS